MFTAWLSFVIKLWIIFGITAGICYLIAGICMLMESKDKETNKESNKKQINRHQRFRHNHHRLLDKKAIKAGDSF